MLWAGLGGLCQGCVGVICPSSKGQAPKDVVVGTPAAWAGPAPPQGAQPKSPLPPQPQSEHQWARPGQGGGAWGQTGAPGLK